MMSTHLKTNNPRLTAQTVISSIFLLLLLCTQAAAETSLSEKLSAAAIERTKHDITYDGRYFSIPYPNGDIPEHLGVCTDVVIRTYRALGIDLQQRVHTDMKANFSVYPKHWGLSRPDTNIDHRRVPNLRVFFTRHGQSLPVTDNPDDYKTGDIVTWALRTNGSLPHIGIVTHLKSGDDKRPLIVHNIGAGTTLEDMLFSYKITGHYRYAPE